MKKSNKNDPKIFVWRGKKEFSSMPSRGLPRLPFDLDTCPYCGTPIHDLNWRHKDGTAHCHFCGFSFKVWGTFSDVVEHDNYEIDTLRKLSVNDSDLCFSDLAEHLKRRKADIYKLTPRRFETVVADVFKTLGYETTVTCQTCDGGADIVLLKNNSTAPIIVECKRYRSDKKVGVGIVREVLGAQLLWGTNKAKIVTTSAYSVPAHDAAQHVALTAGYDIELLTASELLGQLDNLNHRLPPLHLNPEILRRMKSS